MANIFSRHQSDNLEINQEWVSEWLSLKAFFRFFTFPYMDSTQSTFYNKLKQGKSEGSDSCDQPSNLTEIGFKS